MTSNDSRLQELQATLASIRQLESQIPGRGKPVAQMIMRDAETPPQTFTLERGDFLRPDEKAGPLTAGVPVVFQQIPDGVDGSRLDLAKWLVRPDNPLTARVTTNRYWMRLFGLGLVETENDFGYQGSPPSHPLLLDWLAGEYPRREWSTKSWLRLVLTSSTYRQSSQVRDDLLEADAANHWLARQSRLRVDAEIVRDLALSASGALVSDLGGASVHPPQPEGVYSFTQTPKAWPENKDGGRYRRTLYTEFFRSAPYPLFGTFDAPDFSTVCTRRVRSNTPLQALTVANDQVFIELARNMVEDLLREHADNDDLAQPIRQLYLRCFSRLPSDTEQQQLTNYWRASVARFSADAAGTKAWAPASTPTPAGAAWTNIARALLNTDEFVTRE